MSCRRRRDAKRAPPWRRDIDALPRRESHCVLAQAHGAGARGQHSTHIVEQRAARPVEVVEVVIMAQEHNVDAAKLARVQGRPFELVQQLAPGRVVAARRIESRIRQQPQSADFGKRGRTADVSEPHASTIYRGAYDGAERDPSAAMSRAKSRPIS